MRRVWIEIVESFVLIIKFLSPSMRRVWIEIGVVPNQVVPRVVTLHAEGVD